LILADPSPSSAGQDVVVRSRERYPVTLTDEDREALEHLTRTGVHSASTIRRAQVLLALDCAGENDSRESVGARVGVSRDSVRLISMRFAETGGDVWATIGRKQREFAPVPSPITGEVEARLIAMACSTPPAGFSRWSLRLLEKHVALVEGIPDLDHSTIGRVLKKRNCVLI